MNDSPLSVSEVLANIEPGSKDNPSWINGGIHGIATVKDMESKAGKKFWKLILTDQETHQTIETLTFQWPKVENGQHIAITGQGIMRTEDNAFKGRITAQFKYGPKAFIQVLDNATSAPKPKASAPASKTTETGTMQSNINFYAQCLISSYDVVNLAIKQQPLAKELLNDAKVIQCIAASLFIEGNKQGITENLAGLATEKATAKRVASDGLLDNTKNLDGSDTGDDDVPF